jgi:hypothetical protein
LTYPRRNEKPRNRCDYGVLTGLSGVFGKWDQQGSKISKNRLKSPISIDFMSCRDKFRDKICFVSFQ